MKRTLLILLLLPFALIAQKQESIVFKGATKITVKNNLTADENYKLAINKLLDNGFSIESKDAEYKTIKTQIRKIGNWTYKGFLNIRAKENEIIFSGMFDSGIEINVGGVTTKSTFEPIVYKNSGGNKMVFKDMENTALMFSMPLNYSN